MCMQIQSGQNSKCIVKRVSSETLFLKGFENAGWRKDDCEARASLGDMDQAGVTLAESTVSWRVWWHSSQGLPYWIMSSYYQDNF